MSELPPGVFGPVVINLDRDTQRWSDLVDHLAQWGLVPQRLPAVEQLPGGFTLPERRTRFEACLSLSWVKAVRGFLSESDPYLLVLEDDCRFLQDPAVLIDEALTTVGAIQPEWSVISLGGWRRPRIPRWDYSEVRYDQPTWNLWGSHSVLINRLHAERLLPVYESCRFQTDGLLNDEYKKKLGFVRRPAGTYQHSYVSHREGRKVSTELYADLPEKTIKELFGSKKPYARRPLSGSKQPYVRRPRFWWAQGSK